MATPKIKTSGFASIDVTAGRKALAKVLKGKNTSGPATEGFPIRIIGYVTSTNSRDDGVSIEFGIDIIDFKISPLQQIP